MKRRTFLTLSSSLALNACWLRPRPVTTTEALDPNLIAEAQIRAADGILRAEDVRAGFDGDTVGAQSVDPRVIARSGSGDIAEYVAGTTPLPPTTPEVSKQELNRFYAARGYQPLWYVNGERTQQAFQLFAAMVNAPIDGLLPGDYMPGERALSNRLNVGSAHLAQVDIELTAGLMRYIRDAREGRYSGNSGLDVLPLTLAVINANTIEAGLDAAVNQGETYLLIRRLGKRYAQFLNAAEFEAYRVTMEKLRAEPVSFGGTGKYLISNIAAQEVLAMRDGKIELAMNMVVGRPTRQTPVNNDNIVSVKFSPDWTAPKSIVRKDLIPKAPQIFEDMGIEIRQDGQIIDPTGVAWTPDQVDRYEFVQPPGPLNVLGGVRFTLQNSSAIYMHDSPDRVLFNKVNRIYSSGCMRLEKSAELALWLLQDQDPSWTLERVRESMSQPDISFVRLDQKVPVKTVYMEAWPSHKGGLRVVPDIYGLNTQLREKMGIAVRNSNDPTDLSTFWSSIF